jgi:hypothetical protein
MCSNCEKALNALGRAQAATAKAQDIYRNAVANCKDKKSNGGGDGLGNPFGL